MLWVETLQNDCGVGRKIKLERGRTKHRSTQMRGRFINRQMVGSVTRNKKGRCETG